MLMIVGTTTSLFGQIFTGYFSQKIGRKKTITVFAVAFLVSAPGKHAPDTKIPYGYEQVREIVGAIFHHRLEADNLLGHVWCNDCGNGRGRHHRLKFLAITASGTHDKRQIMPAIKFGIVVDRRRETKIHTDKWTAVFFDGIEGLISVPGLNQSEGNRTTSRFRCGDFREKGMDPGAKKSPRHGADKQ